MKKRYWILGSGVVALITIGIIIYSISADKNENGTAISIIGGADGPTSIFMAEKSGGDGMAAYKSITMDEAKKAFAVEGDYLILDVRREDEFAEGHIPGAINIANETIGTDKPEGLPDLDKVIYVYCRSGRRSKEAAAKLAAIGYTSIIECGGILDWTGDMEEGFFSY